MIFDQIRAALNEREPPPLFPDTPWQPELSQRIQSASDDEMFGQSVSSDRAMRDACRAGLLLCNDDLHASHTLSQGVEDATGSFWHAIMHRREGDAANSNYWWRKVGAHPAFAEVHHAALEVLREESDAGARDFAAVLERAGSWQPSEFVARCDRAGADDLWLRRVQAAEMKTLLDWCHARLG